MLFSNDITTNGYKPFFIILLPAQTTRLITPRLILCPEYMTTTMATTMATAMATAMAIDHLREENVDGIVIPPQEKDPEIRNKKQKHRLTVKGSESRMKNRY